MMTKEVRINNYFNGVVFCQGTASKLAAASRRGDLPRAQPKGAVRGSE
jgi:hypothetical protein